MNKFFDALFEPFRAIFGGEPGYSIRAHLEHARKEGTAAQFIQREIQRAYDRLRQTPGGTEPFEFYWQSYCEPLEKYLKLARKPENAPHLPVHKAPITEEEADKELRSYIDRLEAYMPELKRRQEAEHDAIGEIEKKKEKLVSWLDRFKEKNPQVRADVNRLEELLDSESERIKHRKEELERAIRTYPGTPLAPLVLVTVLLISLLYALSKATALILG